MDHAAEGKKSTAVVSPAACKPHDLKERAPTEEHAAGDAGD